MVVILFVSVFVISNKQEHKTRILLSCLPSVLTSMVSKNTLFVPVVVMFLVGFEGSRKQQRERADLSCCIPSCLDTVAASSSRRPGRPSFSSSFLSSSLTKPVFLDLPSPCASHTFHSFPSGIRSSSRGSVSRPLESPIGLVLGELIQMLQESKPPPS